MEKFESVIIGAGVVGLGIARKFALAGKNIAIIEANKAIGAETSFRNSAVIHAGIYYTRDSLKAKLCVEGKEKLYSYCNANNITCKKIGKLIVATAENQLEQLQGLLMQGKINNVKDLKIIDKNEVNALEPNVNCLAALFSPSTGIINGLELMKAYKHDIEKMYGKIICGMKMINAKILDTGFEITISDGIATRKIYTEVLINSAGLWAQEVSHKIEGLEKSIIPNLYYAKGNYFKYTGKKKLCSRLIYPLPEKGGLGIHATIDVAGNTRFGPDVEWVDSIDYSVNVDKKEAFYCAIQRYLPDIKMGELVPEFCGIRPKLNEYQSQDFEIQSEKIHGIKNLINLYGIESPGLTCSLSLADYVYDLIN